MYQSSIIDRSGSLSRILTSSPVWKAYTNQLFSSAADPAAAQVVWIAIDKQDEQSLQYVQQFSSLHQNATIILLCKTQNNAFTRNAFLSGVFDCLTLPIPDTELKRIFLHLDQKFTPELSSELLHAEQDFVTQLLNGSASPESRLFSIFHSLENDCRANGKNPLTCLPIVRDRMITMLLQKAPFLENYLWNQAFCTNLNTLEETRARWQLDCSLLSMVLSRYHSFRQQHVREAARYIMQHPDGKHSLNEIAERIHLNSSYLSHLFRQETGITLVQYITEQKVNRAKILLLNDEMKIHEIAILLGYNEAEYFRKIFKNTCGQSPTVCKAELTRKFKPA